MARSFRSHIQKNKNFNWYTDTLQIVSLILLSFYLSQAFMYDGLACIIAAVAGLVYLVYRNRYVGIVFCLAFAIMILLEMVYFYYIIANHVFLAFYSTLITLLFLVIRKRSSEVILLAQRHVLLASVILVSVLQKIIDGSYFSGAFWSYMLGSNRFFQRVISFFSQDQVAQKNLQNFEELSHNIPVIMNSEVIKFEALGSASSFYWLAVALGTLVILLELAIGTLFLMKPKQSKFVEYRYALLIFFLLLNMIFLNEKTFVMFLSFLALWKGQSKLSHVLYFMVWSYCAWYLATLSFDSLYVVQKLITSSFF